VLVTSIAREVETTLGARMPNATVHQRFGALITEAGGIPVLSDAWSEPADLVDRVDAVVINGGLDVDPARYAQERLPSTDEPDPVRDAFELGLIEAAHERGLPVLGICRGMQLLNIARGGTLIQDLSTATDLEHFVADRYDQPVHGIEIERDSLVAAGLAARETTVNSVHHQGLDRVADGLRAVAYAPDRTVEAIEDESGRLVGVQWHPEFLAGPQAAAQVGLFTAFLSRARPPLEATASKPVAL
jgi:putative glutamine amidotransferase